MLMFRWQTVEKIVEPGDENVKFFTEYLFMGLESFTRYALYVQTYTTKAIGLDGAQSPIVYFKTAPSSMYSCSL